MSEISQRVLDLGENSIFIDADPDESSSNSFWLRIGRLERDDTRHVRLTAHHARALGYALLVHAEGLDDRQKHRNMRYNETIRSLKVEELESSVAR